MIEIESGEVHVYTIDLDDYESDLSVTADRFLTLTEIKRADQFIFPIHRQRFIRGRSWMRETLGSYLSVDPQKLEVVEGEHGKPAIKNNSLAFNLSHAENRAVLAVTKEQAVGIDIESDGRKVEITALSKLHFTQAERDWLSGWSSADQQQAFFSLWTAKEARMKLTGEGFALPSTQIELCCGLGNHRPSEYLHPTHPSVYLQYLDNLFPTTHCALATTFPVTRVFYSTRNL